jgi:L-lactate dehydrogenase
VLVVACNPVDVMTVVALRHSGLAAGRVIGTGTLLDSSRLKQSLAAALDIAPNAIGGFVLGEHGDSEVAAFSTVRIGGETLQRFVGEAGGPDVAAIAEEVRTAGYRIIQGKGYTSFGIGTAIVRICEAVLRDERTVLPVSAWLDGAYGIDGICLSLPCVLGANGIERIVLPALAEAEQAALLASAKTLQDALASLDLGA